MSSLNVSPQSISNILLVFFIFVITFAVFDCYHVGLPYCAAGYSAAIWQLY